MIKTILASAVFLAALAASATEPHKVIADKSYIRFVSKQMNVPVEGRFRRFDAVVSFDPAKPEATKGQFEVDLASIDLGSPDGETEAKGKLWFDVAGFPKATFATSAVKVLAPGKYEASGRLTIKGVAREVVAPFMLAESGGIRTVEGQFTLKRLQFRIGEGVWSDTETVADDVLVRFRLAIPSH